MPPVVPVATETVSPVAFAGAVGGLLDEQLKVFITNAASIKENNSWIFLLFFMSCFFVNNTKYTFRTAYLHELLSVFGFLKEL